MPTFFHFQAGSETCPRAWAASEDAPLLGRFRVVPPSHQQPPQNRRRVSQPGLFSTQRGGGGQSVHMSYGAVLDWFDALASGDDQRRGWSSGVGNGGDEEEDEETLGKLRRMGRVFWRWISQVWIDPTQEAVRKVVGSWYCRWGILVVFPAMLAVAWCAIPIPQYPLPGSGNGDDDLQPSPDPTTLGTRLPRQKIPGHGFARVQVNFWFFLVIYYSLYQLTALIWITKAFNLYSLNWWPKTLGFPLTMFLLTITGLAVPVPIYLVPKSRWLINHNTAWISWTFIVMAMPVTIAFITLMRQERHLALRNNLSETRRIFTSSLWTTRTGYDRVGYQSWLLLGGAEPPADGMISSSPVAAAAAGRLGVAHTTTRHEARRKRVQIANGNDGLFGMRNWLPSSFLRFIWFCLALFVGLIAYLVGEAYAEMYLRTLPHNSLETIVYVYSWVATVRLLDALTGWILGGNEGERVGSYPLGWVFKLYFMLTYQTYVRALYARLRSPSQFILLQAISSTLLVTVTPILVSSPCHHTLRFLGFNNQSYPAYQKTQARNVFIRGLAENVSMLAFLGSVVVLHFGANKDVYPYFAFDFEDDDYDFDLTFKAAAITWACELIAQLVVRALVWRIYRVHVAQEGKLDLAVWPELLPTSVVVMLHVLQNMLFSIIRLRFH